MTKKYNDKKSVAGAIIKKERLNQGMRQIDLRRELELKGIDVSKEQLIEIEKNNVIIKDFELIAIFDILNLDMNILKNLIQ